MRILSDVIPKPEQVESWMKDELITVPHEAVYDLGIVQKTLMMVLRHALSGMKVRGTVPRSKQNAYRPVD